MQSGFREGNQVHVYKFTSELEAETFLRNSAYWQFPVEHLSYMHQGGKVRLEKNNNKLADSPIAWIYHDLSKDQGFFQTHSSATGTLCANNKIGVLDFCFGHS